MIQIRKIAIFSLCILTFKSLAIVTVQPDNSNIKYNGVVEKTNGSSGMELYRLKKAYIDAGNGAYWAPKNAGTQSGIAIQIKTASPNVKFNFSLNSTYEDRYAKLLLYRNGEEVKTVQGGPGVSLSIAGTNSSASSLWTCVLPSFKAQYFNSIELDDGYSLESINSNSKPVYVALGNSITHGVGQSASNSTLTYAWQVAEALGYELYNFAVGGSKIHTQTLDNLSGINPDLVTVLWGYNDVNAPWDLSKAMGIYDSLMTVLVENYPKTKIIAIEQTYTTTTTGSQVPANTISRLRTEQRAILETLQETYKNLFIVSGLDYTDATSLNDVVHLNDKGAKDLADGLISEIPTFKIEDNDPLKSDTIVFRSEYEKVGDTLFSIPTYKALIADSSDLSNVIVSSSGDVIISTEITDVRYDVHSIIITAEQVNGDTIRVLIVDGVDYWLEEHGGSAQGEHLDMKLKGDWATHNNLWGRGTAVPGTDFRIEMAYTDGLPDSTLFVWDVPSVATEFNGSSVWNFSNMLWGNRYGERDDLTGFPFKLNDYDSLILDFDYTTIHNEEGHKVSLNMFTTETDTLAPFDQNRGDFFMVFDQKGTWVPNYPDTLHSDTSLLGASFILMHKEGIKNSAPYHWRRAIIKDSETVDEGSIDLLQLFKRFDSDGYMDLSLSIPNIQFGVEVTDGLGAIRINTLSINPKDSGQTMLSESAINLNENINCNISANVLKVNSPLKDLKRVSIINLQGKVVKEVDASDNALIKVNLSGLSKGLYINRVELLNGNLKTNQFLLR